MSPSIINATPMRNKQQEAADAYADALVQLNQIDGDAPLTEGAKLLIVR